MSLAATIRIAANALAIYLATWLAAFLALIGDGSLMGDYFRWGWAGGGELPVLINLAALASTLAFTVFLLVRKAKRR